LKSTVVASLRALKDYPEVQFDVQEFQGGVMATFAQKQPESPDEGVSEGVNVGVNVGVSGLLAYVQANPGQRAGEMAVIPAQAGIHPHSLLKPQPSHLLERTQEPAKERRQPVGYKL
jgi:hypothetical protein